MYRVRGGNLTRVHLLGAVPDRIDLVHVFAQIGAGAGTGFTLTVGLPFESRMNEGSTIEFETGNSCILSTLNGNCERQTRSS
eukprot:COSAG02_NODE_25846_length_647_cov_1.133212_2_plen_81_part_01